MLNDLSFGSVIAVKRQQKKLSSRQVSIQAGLSPGYLSKIESGATMPSLQAFSNIMRVLECTDAEILFLVRLAREV